MENYNLGFFEAAEKCLHNKGFIRGKEFKEGVFVENVGGVLTMRERTEHNYHYLGNLPLTLPILSQKYKLFPVANAKELELKK